MYAKLALLAVALLAALVRTSLALNDCFGDKLDESSAEKIVELKAIEPKTKFPGMGTKLSGLNEYLEDTVSSFTPEDNIVAIKEYKEKLSPGNEQLAAIQAILEVYGISKGPKCTAEEFDVLDSLDELLERKASQQSLVGSHCRRRIDDIVNRVFFRYARGCVDTHRKMIADDFNGVDEFARKTSLSLTNKLLIYRDQKSSLYPFLPKYMIDRIVSLKSLLDHRSLVGLVASIRDLAEPGEIPAPKETPGMSLDASKKLLTKYVVDGCQILLKSIDKSAKINFFDHLVYPHLLETMYSPLDRVRVISASEFCKVVTRESDQLAIQLSNNWTELNRKLSEMESEPITKFNKLRQSAFMLNLSMKL